MRDLRLVILFSITLLLAACVPIPPAAPPPVTSGRPVVPPRNANAVEYNLGETTITQSVFPEDSRFRNMPVRLNGMIAVPQAGDGPFPVIVILHGTHPGCPVIDEVDRWPCKPEEERTNYQGFGYLAEALAEHGYIGLTININAEYTFGFGEPVAGERLAQLLDKHLAALVAASSGGENNFGVELKGLADLQRIGLVGHSRAGELALMLARDERAATGSTAAYGSVAGVLQVAPSPVTVDPAAGSPAPLGILQPVCDGDVHTLDGQVFYEAARLATGQTAWVNTVFLERANHNGFNTMLGSDPFGVSGRPDCTVLLSPQTQQEFLAAYAIAFFDSLFAGGAQAEQSLMGLGMDARLLAPKKMGGLDARVAALYPAQERIVIFTPADGAELTTNALGGAVTAEGVTTHFCEAGYYTPMTKPGSEPCRRVNVVIPGNPALAVVSWEQPGAVLRFEIPQGKGDLSQASSTGGAISLRTAIDPLSELNPAGQAQAFSVRLTDRAGKTATVAVRPDEPALRFPAGEVEADAIFGDLFTGRVPLTTVRLLLSDFQEVDLADIREIALLFDRAPAGSLFLADLEWVQAKR